MLALMLFIFVYILLTNIFCGQNTRQEGGGLFDQAKYISRIQAKSKELKDFLTNNLTLADKQKLQGIFNDDTLTFFFGRNFLTSPRTAPISLAHDENDLHIHHAP